MSKSDKTNSVSKPKMSSNKNEKPLLVEEEINPWNGKSAQDMIVEQIDPTEIEGTQKFRCAICKLCWNSIDKLIAHHCWRKYYDTRLNLINSRLLRCGKCMSLFLERGNYEPHACITLRDCEGKISSAATEQVFVLDKWMHLDFYINWRIRTKIQEINLYKPIIGECSNCNAIFFTLISLIFHQCLQDCHLLDINICKSCKLVFCKRSDLENHFFSSPKCNNLYKKEQARIPKVYNICKKIEMEDIGVKLEVPEKYTFLRTISKIKEKCEVESTSENCDLFMSCSTEPAFFNCVNCSEKFSDKETFLLHTCVAGHLLNPIALHLVLFCKTCKSLFVKPNWYVDNKHICKSQNLSMVRITEEIELKIFLRRWVEEKWMNTKFPERPCLFRCEKCNQQFRNFGTYLKHQKNSHPTIRSPLCLQETYVCASCNIVLFRKKDCFEHLKNCEVSFTPKMISMRYLLEEAIDTIYCWTKLPKCMDFKHLIS